VADNSGKKLKTLYRNVQVLEKIIIGDNIITIEENPKRHVRIRIESAEPVDFVPNDKTKPRAA